MAEQQQPYDSRLKALLEEQVVEMLPYLLAGATFLEELNVEVLRPPLRVDRVYKVLYKGKSHILHIELESSSNSKMDQRLLTYHAIIFEKYSLPVISIIIYPFEVSVVESPLQEMSGDDILLTFHYRILRLWVEEAKKYLEEHALSMYPLLPAMHGAEASLLLQAIDELNRQYSGETLVTLIVALETLLSRAEIVSLNDKDIVQERLHMFDSLLEQNPRLQKMRENALAEGEARGRAEGRVEGEARGELQALRQTSIALVQARFPDLTEIVQKLITQVEKPAILRQFIVEIATVPDEDAALRLLLMFK